MYDIERRLDGLQKRRMAQEDRFLARIDRLERKAEALVGKLCREGRTVYYVNAAKGPREFSTEIAAIEWLIRNRYVI